MLLATIAIWSALLGGAFAQLSPRSLANPSERQIVALTGKIIELQRDDSEYLLLIGSVNGAGQVVEVEHRHVFPEDRILSVGDVISMEARVTGSHPYKMHSGETVEAPYLVACELHAVSSPIRHPPGEC